ncbi:TetR/AcrR family transcriptional regulator [Alloalcanivorax mobilis]|uniref:TetR/AcrR family transcriptional regulator n=1 Tax=Alloalcanivorax mobilis TaxID=2019569 RepID=UPI000C77A639|nr:TetR/AcrR family transcriptional regulator [Alloalcanivorax mobilis]
MRKRPQQQRSRRMVTLLLDATAASLTEHGLDGATTVRIAERAGVSVGSLYQYFDGKEALILALMERLADQVAQGLKRLPLLDNSDLRQTTLAAIRFGFSMLHSGDGLYLELVRNWHRLPTNTVADVLQQHFMELARLYFLKHYRDYPIDDLQVRMFIVANSVLFTMVRHVSQGQSVLREEQIAEGLTRMVADYMMAPSPAR